MYLYTHTGKTLNGDKAAVRGKVAETDTHWNSTGPPAAECLVQIDQLQSCNYGNGSICSRVKPESASICLAPPPGLQVELLTATSETVARDDCIFPGLASSCHCYYTGIRTTALRAMHAAMPTVLTSVSHHMLHSARNRQKLTQILS